MARLLPTGIQDFANIRNNGYCYVDKTRRIHQMITGSSRAVFLSRPRRFGKSSLCSTIASVFAGERELFGPIAGQPALAIDSLDWDWKKHPVIKLDFSAGNYSNGFAELGVVLRRGLRNAAEDLRIDLLEDAHPSQLMHLLKKASIDAGVQAVVIIDEYDNPLFGSIGNPVEHQKIRNELAAFFAVLKLCDKYLRFAFVTGVTKFSKVELFSGANQLDDISFDPCYADICGITQEELEAYFGVDVDAIMERVRTGAIRGRPASVAKQIDVRSGSEVSRTVVPSAPPTREEYLDEVRGFYNGYRFSSDDTTVYNPYGIIRHFHKGGVFEHFWYESASPSFLIDLVREGKIDIVVESNTRVRSSSFHRINIDRLEPSALLYQSGYLTIADFDRWTDEYVLDFPNTEVRSAFAESLLTDYLIAPQKNVGQLIVQLPRALHNGDIDRAMQIIKAFLASIPYQIIKGTENYYETAIFLIYQSLGMRGKPQYQTSDGRIDTVIETDNYVYCFEYKLDQPPKVALAQINRKEYALQWSAGNRTVFKVGVELSSKTRTVAGYEVEVVEGAG